MYRSWGPGKYDPRFNIDGLSTPLVIPPAYGLDRRGEGDVHGRGTDLVLEQLRGGHADGRPRARSPTPRLGINIVQKPDLVKPKLRSAARLPVQPGDAAPAGGQSSTPTRRRGARSCSRVRASAQPATSRRSTPTSTSAGSTTRRRPGWTRRTRSGPRPRSTAPRRCGRSWQHPPYFHDGSAATLADVVEHYDDFLELGLTAEQKADLVEFLKSL